MILEISYSLLSLSSKDKLEIEVFLAFKAFWECNNIPKEINKHTDSFIDSLIKTLKIFKRIKQ